jgi:hypothetical protein
LFDQDERVNLFIILDNISVTKLSNGKEKFYKELMDIYKAILYHKLYLHSKKEYFQVNLFRNMFYTAMILKEYKWAENFLEDYLDKLSPEQREDMCHYSRTILYFEKGNFEKALEEIVRVNYKFFVYKYE